MSLVEAHDPRLRFLEVLDGVELERHLRDDPMDDSRWYINDSGIDEYFDPVELRGSNHGVYETVREQIEGMEDPVGIDIAGGTNGVALRELIDRDVLTQGLVTNYQDMRDESTRRDARLSHVEGSLLDIPTWQEIINWQRQQAAEGAALVMHRPWGALQGLPPVFYRGAMHLVLDITRPKGIVFAQVPVGLLGRYEELKQIGKSVIEREDVQEMIVPKNMESWSKSQNCMLVIKR